MEIKNLFNILEKLAPGLSTDDFTNSVAGEPSHSISRLGVCVDPTAKNIENASRRGIEVLISYHPWQGEAEKVIQSRGIAIWPLHASWDTTAEGVTFTFAKAIGATGLYLKGELLFGVLLTGFRELIEHCQRALGQNVISYCGDLKQPVAKIAIWAGPGFLPNYRKFWEACLAEESDTILSSELTLSALRYSRAHHLNLIDLGHSAMAKPGMSHLVELLREQIPSHDCSIDYLDDMYCCNYYTNSSFAEQFTESEEIFFSAD